jgi:hypothetical protein
MRRVSSWLRRSGVAGILVATLAVAPKITVAADVPVDLSGLKADCEIKVKALTEPDGTRLAIQWPVTEHEGADLMLDARPGRPLIEHMRHFWAIDGAGAAQHLLQEVDPAYFITVGTRVATVDRPPGMSPFNEFFDAPAKRPHKTYRSEIKPRAVRVTGQGCQVSVSVEGLSAGPFSGSLQIHIYSKSRLIQIEAVVSTNEPSCAFVYDVGLMSDLARAAQFGWIDTEGRFQQVRAPQRGEPERAVAVRYRTLVAQFLGSIACFPPPHQFYFARDLTDNLSNVWFGSGHRGLDDRFGFGIRQSESGGGAYVPWYNAPPGTQQRLGMFLLFDRRGAEAAIKEVERYTHGDRFPTLPGHSTFTSHWHMEVALAAMEEQARTQKRSMPDLVQIFKEMGVNIVHLAEFHGQGHQSDPGPIRLPEMEAMFAECRRLSDNELLLLPGEEVSGILGITKPHQHPGHWMCLFPKPVYWAQKRAKGAPFVEQVAPYGTVYRVGDAADMARLLEREHGLAWTSHPRIKASSWAPDAFKNEEYYKADYWLGAAWKGMPVDLSRPRLGERALNLLDDMTGWGAHKYLPGEVDVFKIDHTHELYGHMNINYLRLPKVPRFDESWQPVLDALRGGKFFVTTGEVLLREFTVGRKQSGETLSLSSRDRPEVRLDVEWTFPLRFAEIISGDGTRVYRDRIDLSNTEAFGRRIVTAQPDLSGRTWVRAEVWDIAGDGAFTQPVWLNGSKP